MSQRGIDFANHWVSENVEADAYPPEDGPNPAAIDALTRMLADERAKGISREEIEEDVGDLEDFLSEAFDDSADDEVQRMVDKDPY